jgi:hypothetical protein
MLSFAIIFFLLAIIIYVWPTLSIFYFLKRSDEKTPGFLTVNMRIGHYLKRYRKMTKIRDGQAGPLYYFWFFALAISLVLLVLGIFCLNIY